MTHEPARHPESPEVQAIDGEKLMSNVDGDRGTLHEIAGLFLSGYRDELHRIENAVAAGDAPAAERAVHSLKGMLLTLAAEPAAAVAERLEGMGREGDLGGAREALDELRSHLEKVVPAIEEVLRRRAA